MAVKKQETLAEEPVVPQDEQIKEDPGYSYEDIKKESVRDIAAEEPKEEKKEEPKEEKPPVEEPKEEKIDPQKIADEAAQRALEAKEAKDKAEADAKAAEKEANPDYKKIAEDFKKEHGRTPTWDELAVKIEDRALAKLEAKQKETARVEKEQAEQAQKQQNEENTKLNAIIDDELNDLYKAEKLTKIVDKDNPSDQGVVERKALFEAWAKVNMDRRAKGLPDIVSATRIYEFYYKKPSNQPAGVDAPVQGGQGAAQPESENKEYSYNDIRKPWSFFKKR